MCCGITESIPRGLYFTPSPPPPMRPSPSWVKSQHAKAIYLERDSSSGSVSLQARFPLDDSRDKEKNLAKDIWAKRKVDTFNACVREFFEQEYDGKGV